MSGKEHYKIMPFGLESDTVGDVVIDDQFKLAHQHPDSMLCLIPRNKGFHLTSSEAWFYNDCIAYEHDIPAIVWPTDRELKDFGYRYAHSGPSQEYDEDIIHVGKRTKIEKVARKPIHPKKVFRAFFMEHLCSILAETREMRHGPLTHVLFSYPRRSTVEIGYTTKYGKVSKEIGLFSAALRQADFLSEYLGYYRVIESVSKLNGKKWISERLNKIQSHDFGKIMIQHSESMHYFSPRNILGIYKRRALSRWKQLKEKYPTPDDIAKHLYNTVRCGIAHGKDDDVLRGDIASPYFDVAKDTVLVKLLARMAIEEKSGVVR